MDQEEDKAYDQPDDWEGVEDALEKSSQFSVLRDCSRVGRLNAVGIHTHHDWIRDNSSFDIYRDTDSNQR